MDGKERILQILRDTGDFVSGEELAMALGISRGGVWKQISQLREMGYEIQAVTNRGYRLTGGGDRLSEGEIRRWLQNRDRQLVVLGETDSTNLRAKELAQSGAKAGTAVIADSQTRGRGRLNRRFFSPPGTGLYMSLILRPELNLEQAGMITTYAAVTAARAVESLCGYPVQIKWVNDLYMDGKKVCGILTEAAVDLEGGRLRHAVVGIGINVGHAAFPEEIRAIASTVEDVSGRRISRAQLCAEILNGLDQLDAGIREGEYIREYRSRSCVISREVTVYTGNEEYCARAVDIDDSGALIVEAGGELRRINAGEVSIRLGGSGK